MNKIFKVIYSKTRHCYVVVSELAKSHCKTAGSHTARNKTALTAAVLLALGTFTFAGMPGVVQAEANENNYFTAYNKDYFNQDGTKNTNWTNHKKANTIAGDTGAKGTGAIAAGMFAQAGQQTITIGNRNAAMSMGSVFVGEYDHKQYDNPDGNTPKGEGNYYVTSVGFMSNATKYGTIAIGANASAEGEENNVTFGTNTKDKSGAFTTSLPENPTITGASVALGYSAKAKAGNIAIGSYSVAEDAASTLKDAVFSRQTASDVNSYISVGDSSKKLLRRVTGVADGAATSDVATVGQLQNAIESVGATGWKLSTGGDGTNATTINAGTTVDFSAAVDGKNGTTGHSNVTISNTDADKPTSNVKIGLNKDIILGEAIEGEGGSLNVYSDSTEASNLGNRVSIDGSTVSVNYGSEEGTSGTKRGVVLGVGEDWNHNAQGYIAFNNIDPKGKIDSTYLHSATDAPDNLKGRLVYSNTMSGTEYIANLDDGITFTGDVQKDVPNGSTQTPTKLNTTLNITGGATTESDLTAGNIGVVSTPAAESADGTQNQASKLEIKLNKDLKGITSITSKSTTNSTGAKIELGANGTTISGGNVNVSNNKVTGLANGVVSTTSTDAITGQQLNAVKTDLTKDLTVNAGWGLEKEGNTISLERNLGKNYGVTKNSKGKVEFEATGNNSLILGGSAINDTWYAYEDDKNKYLDHAYGTFQDDSVLVGGENNATGTKDEKNSSREKGSVVVGGRYNTASGCYTLINGGSHNITNGDYSAILGGYKNEVQKSDWTAYSTIVGGAYNIASGTGATAVGGGDEIYGNKYPIHNIASGSYSTTVGGKGNEASGKLSVTVGGVQNKADGWETVVIGGFNNEALSYYGNQIRGKQPFTEGAIVVGGQQNKNSGGSSSIFGGFSNLISIGASTASIVGGVKNFASGSYTTVGGGQGNVVLGYNSTAFGGFQSIVNGSNSTGIAGGSTENYADLSLAAGYLSTVTEDAIGREYLSVTEEKYKELMTEMQSGKMSGYYQYAGQSDGKYTVLHYKDISTALGYQATADKPGTIALGHDKGDAFLTYKWQQKAWKDENSYYTRNINTGGVKEISEEEYQKLQNSDGTWNDYTISPNVERGTYDTAYYNRLVKADDGRDAHDVVVMKQLTPYTKSNASNIGANLKTYTVGNDGETITEADASDADKTVNENAWGTAIGNGKIADPTKSDTNDPKANGSKQLVTSGTVYSYNKPVAVSADKPLKYVKEGKTTGENLGILDATLNDKNHNIKYYAVDETTLPKLTNFNGKDYSNEKNDGAMGMGSIAAGFNTHADGIISTVAGSYSGVIGTGLQGATALSYGTFNVNQNTDSTKAVSGVANSIIGQANVTTDSNAAIIYGAGNTVTNSYRDIDTSKVNLNKVKQDLKNKDVAAVIQDAQKAVPASGGQVMVMGGGNNVESAYMTQVVGVGNTVKGNQVYTKDEKTGEWNWTTDTNDETAIEDYDPKKSSQYNYVDGFSNEVINGKHDYVIGANNTVTGDSYDDKDAKKYSNESNIIFGDNHTVTNTKNAVIIGSSDTQMTLDQGDRATAIGYNASAQRDALAVGVNTQARGNAVALGTYSTAHNNSIAIGTKATAVSSQNLAIGWEAHIGNIKTDDEKIKNAIALGSDSQVRVNDLLESDHDRGVLSIGDKNKERRIIHVRAGVNDTDAVNVSQLKSVQSGLTDKGLTFVTNDGERTAKLGSKVTIQGTAKKDGHEYTADNLTTEIDGSGNITILMDKDMSTETLAVNGKDGKDGNPGTAGSIGINGKDGQAGIGIDGKDGISIKGTDGKDGVTIKVDNGKDGKDGSEGHIGLTGRDGSSADIIVKKGYDDTDKGINGTNGVDGKDGITRIVYTDKTGEHQVATMEDGLKFKGDDGKEIAKKLNNTLDIIGGADSMKLTEKNIGVNKTDDGKLKIQLAQELNGITSIGNQKTEDGKTTGGKITFGTDSSVNVNGGKITNVGNGVEKDGTGKYTVTEQNKTNGANIGDVQNIVNDAKKELTDSTNSSLNGKANVDASNLSDANVTAWQKKLGNGSVADGNSGLVNGGTLYSEVRPADGNYVKSSQTTGANLKALDDKIGTLDNNGNYIQKDATISQNLKTLDTQVKNNTDAISNINTNIGKLSDSVVKYDGTDKKTVTLAGEGGTTITNVKDGALNKDSTDAVNGKQLWQEQQDRKDMKNLSDTGKTVIRELAKGSVKVIDGTNTKVSTGTDGDATTYAVNVEGKGTVASGDTGLISGSTAYTELRPADGTYVKRSSTTAANLSALDTGLKNTSSLIHTNTSGDTIHIGETSKATKVDVSSTDANGNKNGRVVTGVVTDVQDASSAANVGYVNGVTAANTQQIYRDMNNAYSRLDTNINRAAAGSNALAALHPLDFDPADKASFAVGYGHYHNANAAAIGAFYQPNANTMVNMGISLGNGDPGFNAGVSFKIGKGSAYNGVSKAEMAQTIHDQAAEISTIKANDAAKDKRIDALEKENQEMKKQIQEILARLNG